MPCSRPPRAAMPTLLLAVWLPLTAHASATVTPREMLPPPASAYAGGPAEAEAKSRAASLLQARRIARPATVNQDSWDARYYSLDIAIQPSTSTITSTVRAVVTVTNGPLSTLELDLRNNGLTVDGVTCAGAPTTFTHSADLLTITLDHAYATGENVDVTVQYHGTPDDGGFGYFTFQYRNGQPIVSSLSEPFGAHYWWPCKDQPADKADSVDVRVTAPSGMKTASNGTLVSATDDGIHSVWQWHERHPIATYLVCLTSYPYTVYSDWYHSTPTDSMEIKFFIFPSDLSYATTQDAKVKNMIAAESARYGPYPFLDEKYGQAEFTFGGGMEHQTCTFLGAFGDGVEAHELGHHWWGDMVTCADFHHVWLNEGFATYTEAIWAEANGGYPAYKNVMEGYKFLGSGTVYKDDLSDISGIFDFSTTYEKGSWVLHMLRHVVGDTTFFQALRHYGALHAYGAATTEDFEAAVEDVAGLSLQKFFQEWIYGSDYPQYRVTYTSAPAGGGYDVNVWVTQEQASQAYWMPMDLTIHTGSGAFTSVVGDSLAFQAFTVHVPAAPTSVQIDQDDWILHSVVYPTAVGPVATIARLELRAPSPNPVTRTTTIAYTLPRAASAEISVVDAAGRSVARLARGMQSAGAHAVHWDAHTSAGAHAAAGLYWVVLESGGERRVQRLAIAR